MRSNLIDVEVLIVGETDLAIKVWLDKPVRDQWIPKSQVEIERDPGGGRLATITLPEWLAIEKELV
jgi:hypothetical protein